MHHQSPRPRAAALALLLALLPATGIPADLPDARASDPVALGWMVGTPPPDDRTIRIADGSHYRFPQVRWTFSHWRELFPTRLVAHGTGPVSPLPRARREEPLDSLTFTPMGGTAPVTWAESLAANYTDGIVVLHDGEIVYERYFGALRQDASHIAFSVTKSYVGTLAAMLVAEGRLDAAAPVTRYIPELAGSGFADATVTQVLDMTTALDYSEIYGDPANDFVGYARAAGLLPRPPGDPGPADVYDYARSIAKAGTHGNEFHYASPNTDVAGWLVARVAGQPVDRVLEERIWSRLGAEGDAYMALDARGTPLAAGGFNARLRDFARFGEMMRLGGRWNGQQVVPKAVVEEIRRGASREAFVHGGYRTLPGWSYNDQWWIAHDDHGTFMARGIHGQAIYVDPKARMVIARFASHPTAANVHLDPMTLPAFRAVADHLLRQ